MNYLHYIDGDVTDSQSPGNKVIAHVCNESGAWSGRKSTVIARKWPQARRAYRQCYLGRQNFRLGSVQFVNVHPTDESKDLIRIANMIARTDVNHPVQYRAFRRCLKAVARKAIKIRASVHMPNLEDEQTDKWPDLELIIYNTLCTAHISVYIYNSKPPVKEKWVPASKNGSTNWLPLDSKN